MNRATLPTLRPELDVPRHLRNKEVTDAFYVVGLCPETAKLRRIATVKCYMGRSPKSSVVHASLHLHFGSYAAGFGGANGGGYHKVSAAVHQAIESAGIKLAEPIDGRGNGAIIEALSAIATAGGFTQFIVIGD